MLRNSIGFRPRLECLEDRAVPATFNVTTTLDVVDPADGKRSLREAVTAANNLAGADVIVLQAGLFKIALTGADEDGNLTGDFDISDTLTIRGAGKGKTIIDGQHLDRILDVAGTAPSSIKVVLEKTTIRTGNAIGPGGGIRVGNADLVVRDSVVTGNQASESGGGISNVPGTANVTLARTTVSRNVAGSGGGGISVTGISVLTVKATTIRRNIAGVNGGGIFADTATLINSTISGNSASSAGGGIWVSDTATLTGSNVTGNTATLDGGGINAFATTLTTSTVSGNSAGANGGGINANTTATLTGSTVGGNSAELSGGGIRATTATLSGCIVSGNSAGGGGGIGATTATLSRCTVSGNSAKVAGGGGIAALTTATLSGCTVSGNSAKIAGGGLFANNTANLTRSTVSGNTAGTNGGGIIATTATLTNSTVSGNTAGTNGGGLWADAATLLNCTIVENIAQTGGGLFHEPGGVFNVRNTIVALNLVEFGGTGPDLFGSFASQGHNLIGINAGGTGFTNGVNGDLVGTVLNPIDPKLGPLAGNGGRTKTHALLAGSRAIDAGDNSILPPTDQRGLPRVKDGNFNGVAIVDIGAFER
jgi:predicted outer membrane repeat protein